MEYDDDRIILAARELLVLGAQQPRDWLDVIAWPDLRDTCWGKRSHDNDRNVVVMRRGGVLDYKRESTKSPGTWVQVGNAVRWRINDYSTHASAVFGDRIRGMAENDDDQEWTWAAVQLAPDAFDAKELPELPPTPRDTPPLKRGE